MGGAVSIKNKPVKSLSTENYLLQKESHHPTNASMNRGGAQTVKRINSENSIRSRFHREQLSMSFKSVAEKYNHEMAMMMPSDQPSIFAYALDPLSPASTASVNTISPTSIHTMKKKFSFNHADSILDRDVPVIHEENEMIDCITDAFAAHDQPTLQQPPSTQPTQENRNIAAHERYSPVIVMDESQVIQETREKFFQTLESVKRRRSSLLTQQQAANIESTVR